MHVSTGPAPSGRLGPTERRDISRVLLVDDDAGFVETLRVARA
jgi:hypothetical protein